LRRIDGRRAMTFFDLVLRTSGSLHPDGEPDDFVTEFTGVMRCEDEAGTVKRVGKVHAYRIEAALAARHGEPLFDVCDAHSQQLQEVHSLLYEPDGYVFKQVVIDRFDAMECDSLVLDYVVLHPRWRGLKLGLLAARKTMDLLGSGCGLTVAEVLPLDADAQDLVGVPTSWIPRPDTPKAAEEGKKQLRRYCRRLGFERIGRTDYYGLSMVKETPTLADLLRPERGERG
jgi:hypothetical protein